MANRMSSADEDVEGGGEVLARADKEGLAIDPVGRLDRSGGRPHGGMNWYDNLDFRFTKPSPTHLGPAHLL